MLIPADDVRFGNPHDKNVVEPIRPFWSTEPFKCDRVVGGTAIAVAAALVRLKVVDFVAKSTFVNVTAAAANRVALQPPICGHLANVHEEYVRELHIEAQCYRIAATIAARLG